MDRKEKIRRYKETPRPAGVYRIAHVVSGRTLLGTSTDAPARLNRDRTQLKLGAHPNHALQADWNASGPEAFKFEVLDLLQPTEGADSSLDDELRVLEELWVEKLGLTGDKRY
jgi:hypothetical protein